jgi:RHS repeat-associated protein
LTDFVGAIVELYAFDAYGNAIGFDPSVALTEFLYSGEQFDAKIGQQYLRQRYYDPATGRFNRLDSFFGNLTDPQSLHKYLYTHADPVNGIDPSGLNIVSAISVATISINIAAASLPILGGAYLAIMGKISPVTLISKIVSEKTWIGAVSGLIGGGLTSGVFQLIAMRAGENLSKNILPFVGLLFSISGVVESAKLTWQMVTEEMPTDDAEQYIASMIVTNFIAYRIGKQLKKARNGSVSNESDYWDRENAHLRAKYENGQQLLPNSVWNKLTSNLQGQDFDSVVQRGEELTKTYSNTKRGLLALQGMYEVWRGQHEGFKSIDDWLQTGLTPSLKIVFDDNISGLAGAYYAIGNFAYEMYDWIFD